MHYLEGKYWCTNRDQALNRATIYMIYRRKMVFNDTTRKGSLHSSMFQEVAGGTYQLCSHGPVDEPKDAPSTRTTLNSMSAGLMEEKDLLKTKHEYNKMHQPKPTPQPTKEKPKRGKPRLQVKVHGIPVCTPWKRDIKCPVCKQVFNLVKDVNLHVKQDHPQFRYKCKYCTKKFQNYASCYKHERKHGTPNHM